VLAFRRVPRIRRVREIRQIWARWSVPDRHFRGAAGNMRRRVIGHLFWDTLAIVDAQPEASICPPGAGRPVNSVVVAVIGGLSALPLRGAARDKEAKRHEADR
jgi:hypothetical protein